MEAESGARSSQNSAEREVALKLKQGQWIFKLLQQYKLGRRTHKAASGASVFCGFTSDYYAVPYSDLPILYHYLFLVPPSIRDVYRRGIVDVASHLNESVPIKRVVDPTTGRLKEVPVRLVLDVEEKLDDENIEPIPADDWNSILNLMIRVINKNIVGNFTSVTGDRVDTEVIILYSRPGRYHIAWPNIQMEFSTLLKFCEWLWIKIPNLNKVADFGALKIGKLRLPLALPRKDKPQDQPTYKPRYVIPHVSQLTPLTEAMWVQIDYDTHDTHDLYSLCLRSTLIPMEESIVSLEICGEFKAHVELQSVRASVSRAIRSADAPRTFDLTKIDRFSFTDLIKELQRDGYIEETDVPGQDVGEREFMRAGDIVDTVVKYMNRFLAYVPGPKNPCIFFKIPGERPQTRKPFPDYIVFEGWVAMNAHFSNNFVFLPQFDKKGNFTGYEKKGIAQIWATSPERNSFLRKVFDPVPTRTPNKDNLNIYIDDRPSKEKCAGSKFCDVAGLLDLLYRMLGRDNTTFVYVLCWMSHGFTFPHVKQGTVPMFIGGLGLGKGFFAKLYGILFGMNGLVCNDPSKLARFNGILLGKLFVLFDDANFKDFSGWWRHMVTEGKMVIEGKFKEGFETPNYLNFMITTNDSGSFQTGLDEMDRRNFGIKCTDPLVRHFKDRKDPKRREFWSRLNRLVEEDEEEHMKLAWGNFLYNFMEIAIDHYEFGPFFSLPTTDINTDYTVSNMGPVASFWTSTLESGTQLSSRYLKGQALGRTVGTLFQWRFRRPVTSQIMPNEWIDNGVQEISDDNVNDPTWSPLPDKYPNENGIVENATFNSKVCWFKIVPRNAFFSCYGKWCESNNIPVDKRGPENQFWQRIKQLSGGKVVTSDAQVSLTYQEEISGPGGFGFGISHRQGNERVRMAMFPLLSEAREEYRLATGVQIDANGAIQGKIKSPLDKSCAVLELVKETSKNPVPYFLWDYSTKSALRDEIKAATGVTLSDERDGSLSSNGALAVRFHISPESLPTGRPRLDVDDSSSDGEARLRSPERPLPMTPEDEERPASPPKRQKTRRFGNFTAYPSDNEGEAVLMDTFEEEELVGEEGENEYDVNDPFIDDN